jgi:hypothetical protein
MTNKDATLNFSGDKSDRKINPRHITSLRMFRTLLPLSDERMGLGSPEAIEGNRQEARQLLLWPPNLFAFTSELLRSTGIYYLVVSPAPSETKSGEIWPPRPSSNPNEDQEAWVNKVRQLGRDWRKALNQESADFFFNYLDPNNDLSPKDIDDALDSLLPKEARTCWKRLSAGFDTGDIKDLRCIVKDPKERKRQWDAVVDLMTLHAVADEACLGWGIREHVEGWDEPGKTGARLFAEGELERRGTLATIHEDRCRVLPKRHTPNVGMTLRSISTNLAFFHRSSIDVKWRRSVGKYLR